MPEWQHINIIYAKNHSFHSKKAYLLVFWDFFIKKCHDLFCHTTTLLHPTMKHLYQMFSTIPRLFCDSIAIASSLSWDTSDSGTRHQM